MTTRQIGGKPCRISIVGTPSFLLVQPTGSHEIEEVSAETAAIAERSGAEFALAAFEISDWTVELTPWPDPAISRDAAVGHHAADTLAYVEQELLPWLHGHFGALPLIVGGYSLAALWSLWAASERQFVTGVAAASPSVWIRHWPDYAVSHPVRARQVYLSLGDREEHTRNQAIGRVGDNIRAYHARLAARLGADHTILEWNSGGHFQDATPRTARAFVWNLVLLSRTHQSDAEE